MLDDRLATESQTILSKTDGAEPAEHRWAQQRQQQQLKYTQSGRETCQQIIYYVVCIKSKKSNEAIFKKEIKRNAAAGRKTNRKIEMKTKTARKEKKKEKTKTKNEKPAARLIFLVIIVVGFSINFSKNSPPLLLLLPHFPNFHFIFDLLVMSVFSFIRFRVNKPRNDAKYASDLINLVGLSRI